ncbi:hypothetical protein GCM10011392_08460 [Wenxinia marina]|nr:hypothetical protein GCM10011392_08460 [Wenxinia marina]
MTAPARINVIAGSARVGRAEARPAGLSSGPAASPRDMRGPAAGRPDRPGRMVRVRRMGAVGRSRAAGDFTWDAAARQVAQVWGRIDRPGLAGTDEGAAHAVA